MRSARPSLVILVLLAAACGDGLITTDGTPPPPLFTVTATADGALDGDVSGDVRAALAWNVYSDELLACLDDVPVDGPLTFETIEDEETAYRLQSCLWFTERGRVEHASVGIEPSFPSSFDIPVATLPALDVLSGEEGALLGIADVLVYTDDDGSGAFDQTARGAAGFTDVVRGTSLQLDEDDLDASFVVYREGALSPLWKLYVALYGCPEPPPGVSTAKLVGTDDGMVTCTVDDSSVTVELAANTRVESLGCAPDPERHVMHRASSTDGIPADAAAVCEQIDGYSDLYVTETPSSVCPSFRQYTLVGCADLSSQDACRETFWDDLGDEPAWWPCKFGDGSRVGIAMEDVQQATDDLDELFALSWFDGLGAIAAAELGLVFTLDEAGTTRTWEPAGLDLVDIDGNGAFNTGDRLLVREVVDVFDDETAPGNYPFRLTVGGVVVFEHVPLWYAPVPLPEVPQIELVVADAAAPITDGIDDVYTVTYGGTGPAYPMGGMEARAYVGGELPVGAAHDTGSIALVNDVDGDGAFGPGDTIVVRDETTDAFQSFTPEVIQSFGGLIYVSIQAQGGFNFVPVIGSGSTTVE